MIKKTPEELKSEIERHLDIISNAIYQEDVINQKHHSMAYHEIQTSCWVYLRPMIFDLIDAKAELELKVKLVIEELEEYRDKASGG
jgi:hypothetical protein